MTLSDRSRPHLAGVHPDLAAIVELAATRAAFHVTEGRRSIDLQRQLVAAGKSRTIKSRHLVGCAVDVVAVTDDGGVTYADEPMAAVADAMKQAATDLGLAVEWGGDWKSFIDTPHFQLPVESYPTGDEPARAAKPDRSGQERAAPVADPPISPSSPKSVPETVQQSRTILGALVALAGTLVQWMDQGLGAMLEAAAKVAEWTPATTLLETLGANTKAAGFGLAVAGIVLVIVRRLNAAQEGKPG